MSIESHVIGYMVPAGKGLVSICKTCAFYAANNVEENATPLYHVNVGLYSTQCFACSRVLHRGTTNIELNDGGLLEQFRVIRCLANRYNKGRGPTYESMRHLWRVRE